MKNTIALLTAALLAGCTTTQIIEPHLTSLVRIDVDGGHGSGVYIGNDIVITAAHVVKDSSVVRLLSEGSLVQSGEVLWANTEYDVAAIRTANSGHYIAAHVACRSPQRGEEITAGGSPLDIDFVYIPGTVIGEARVTGFLKIAVPAAMPVTFGSSGGPVYDSAGDVVGIVSSIATSSFGMSVSQTGISYFVPGDAICKLMGRV